MMKILSILLIISIIINAILIRTYFAKKEENPASTASQQYPLLSPRIFAVQQNDLLINFVPLRNAMRSYMDKIQEPIGVYFEYLPTGNSIGVNEKYEVRLASLIKVPIVMAIYKQMENGNLTEDTILTIRSEDINKEFGDLWKRGVNTKLTVREAIYLAIIDSDNTAARALTRHLSQGAIDNIFDSLDIPKDKEKELPIISPKNYSSILRSLYLSAYLNKENSNEVLELLSRTHFQDRIAEDIANKVKIAHKIGVYNQANQETIYSDCGIFYVPQRPYILCVMVNASEKKSFEYMSYISKMVYGYIIAINK